MLASEKWIGRSGPRESRSWDDRSAFKGSADPRHASRRDAPFERSAEHELAQARFRHAPSACESYPIDVDYAPTYYAADGIDPVTERNERAQARVDPPRMEEVAMCYSRAWHEESERNAREAKEREAQAKRADTVRTLMSEAERQAQEAKAREAAKDTAPAK